ncbi:MAG: putative xanthine dehydrogenase FAD-binding subunit [Actinomycetia bacterium]|nr:putative xanthine dehydrogenase FAD-binding subunit [Actinomycetes bacterium]
MPVLIPDTLEEACAALAAHPGATLLAGGTDLMVGVNAGRTRPDDVVAVGRIAELRGWQRDGDHVVLGAGTTYTQCMTEPLASLVPVLAQAARSVGSPQIRNAGTIGGNLGTASPAGDGTTALVALGGTVRVRSVDGERDLDLATFVTGPRRTERRPDELIVSIRVPVLDGPQEFLKLGTRNAMVIAVASVALVVDAGPAGGSQGMVRLAMGSVGPGPVRATEAEAFAASAVDWTTGSATAGAADEFGALAAAASKPIDDHRSSAAYRRHAVEVLATRAFRRAFP